MEPLLDPCNDRVVKTLPPPPARPLSLDKLYPEDSKVPDYLVLKDHLLKEGKVSKEATKKLVSQGISLLTSEPNLLRLQEPIVLVGDIHG